MKSPLCILHIVCATRKRPRPVRFLLENHDYHEKVQLQYGDDLAGFEAFLSTNAPQHLFAAMPKAIANASQRMRQIEAGVRGGEEKREARWKAFLKSELTQ